MDESGHSDALPIRAADLRITPRGEDAGTTLELRRRRGASAPAVQVAAAAAGGFVAGAAVIGLVQRRNRVGAALAKGRRRRGLARAGASSSPAERAAEALQIVSSRSLLVDVHLLGLPRGD